MIKIGICDDNKTIFDTIKSYLYQMVDSRELQLDYYSTGNQLLESNYNNLDLLFLDIQMPGLNGIETAKEIRRCNEQLILVFMTNYTQYAIEGYSVKAYQYLLKPVSFQRFENEISIVLKKIMEEKKSSLTINSKQGIHVLSIPAILYIETYGKKSLIHTGKETIECYQSIKDLEQQIPDNWYRVHTSYLVNFKYIGKVSGNEITLGDGTNIPVSKYRKQQFLIQYKKYIGRIL